MDTDYLREAFHDDVRLAGPPPTDAYEGVLAGRQKSDRRRLSTLTAGLAVLLVAVAIPVGLSLVTAEDAQVASPASIADVNIFDGPTRGSLSGDTDFLQALTERPWIQAGDGAMVPPSEPTFPNPAVGRRHVAFAGDVAGGRWALVVGPNTTQQSGDPDLQSDLGALSDTAGAWFAGPPGATPDQMQLVTLPGGYLTDRPASLYNGITGALVVLAAPGDSIELSARPEVAADAMVSRSYTDTGTSDGLAVAALAPNPFAAAGAIPAVQYRVARDGAVVAKQNPDSFLDPFVDGTSPEIELDYLLPSQGPSLSGIEQWLAAGIFTQYGLGPDQISLTARYVGAVTNGNVQAELAALTATFPSGAVLTRVFWTEPIMGSDELAGETGSAGGTCMDALSGAGVPAEDRVIAVGCIRPQVGEQAPDPASMLVVLVAPRLGASSVVVQGSSGPISVTVSEQGLALVPFPDGAQTVLILAADGTVLDDVEILTA